MTIKLHPKLHNKKRLIFDMDGVITSEQGYWTTAALTVHELIHSNRGLNIKPEKEFKNIKEIRRIIMHGDKNIGLLKNKAVNTNWDLAYIIFLAVTVQGIETLQEHREEISINQDKWLDALGRELTNIQWTPCWQSVNQILERLNKKGVEIIDELKVKITDFIPLADRDLVRGQGQIWHETVGIFQKWYLGSCAKSDQGQVKTTLVSQEEPLLPLVELKELLEILSEKNFILAVATGRPREEIVTPLHSWGLLHYFDSEAVITYDNVKKAQNFSLESLAKPHPFCFLKAAFPFLNERDILMSKFPKEHLNKCLVIGDSMADFLGAQGAGMDFLGVLSGKSCLGKYKPEDIFPPKTEVINDIRDIIALKH